MRMFLVAALGAAFLCLPVQAGSMAKYLLAGCMPYDQALMNIEAYHPDAERHGLTSEQVVDVLMAWPAIEDTLVLPGGGRVPVVIGHWFEHDGIASVLIMLAGPNRDGGQMCLRAQGALPKQAFKALVGHDTI